MKELIVVHKKTGIELAILKVYPTTLNFKVRNIDTGEVFILKRLEIPQYFMKESNIDFKSNNFYKSVICRWELKEKP